MSDSVKLFYVYDPMCSWCWGYSPTWNNIERALSEEIEIVYVLGGLAPDSNEPMPAVMQEQIASYWKKIESFLGTEFNHEFWSRNSPRRSTYPACRAIIASRSQGKEKEMLAAIQKAYYLKARNPSDDEVLLALAEEIGLDTKTFRSEFFAPETGDKLIAEIHFARSMGGNHFPSLFLQHKSGISELAIDYQNSAATIGLIRQSIET